MPAYQAALRTLTNGGTLLYPTATVWGLGCDATNADAVKKIYQLKKREESKALIVLVASLEQLKEYVITIPPAAYELLENPPRPTTIIYNAIQGVAPNLLAADASLAIRITKHPFCKQLIEQFGKPIVSTSANISGGKTPARFKDIPLEIVEGVTTFINPIWAEKHFPFPTNPLPSRIIKVSLNNEVTVIRA